MRRRPYLVGVAGGSGSGKTTLVRALRDLLPPGSACIVSQDDYYLPLESQQRDANGRYNFDLPGALDLDLLADDLRCLAQGEAVYRQEYTFEQAGAEGKWMEIRPARVILVEGLFLFHHAGLRGLFDLKVYMEASEAVQLHRRLGRDQRERGYTRADVLYQWKHHVLPAYRQYLLPYRQSCDVQIVNEVQYQRGLDVLKDHLARHAGLVHPGLVPA